ncbi:MAG: 16S rRNA (uracil(1498)-N(3))-methyltransferase [Candidatus Omnitrophica bacterium]|nr:16S rRNA (uracil(1498)-N(3))-methyltransferase [Candidatus Omnitrophota bacterium]
MHRFYCPQSNLQEPEVIITDPKELHHLRNVLRLKKGDTLTIFNDQGEEATGRVENIQSNKVTVAVESVRQAGAALPALVLACAVPKKSKFEWIIEKATELGVDEIIPLKTKRTELGLSGERLARKTIRYRDVAVNAAKQSQRLRVPVIHPVTDFAPALRSFSRGTTVFIPSLPEGEGGERKNILEALKAVPAPSRVAFLIGPEGDFTPEEYALARERGCVAVSLGETVLKVETAAITAVACASLFYAGLRAGRNRHA